MQRHLPLNAIAFYLFFALVIVIPAAMSGCRSTPKPVVLSGTAAGERVEIHEPTSADLSAHVPAGENKDNAVVLQTFEHANGKATGEIMVFEMPPVGLWNKIIGKKTVKVSDNCGNCHENKAVAPSIKREYEQQKTEWWKGPAAIGSLLLVLAAIIAILRLRRLLWFKNI